jgi:hypothetical protein
MIPKGLKVGDTFEDGGVLHEVLEVVGENYISRVIDGEISMKVVKEEEVKEVVNDSVDYESMAYAQLKKLCAEKGLDAKGTKADLIARLEG